DPRRRLHAARGRAMTRWWRSHSVRVRLTLSFVTVMFVVLGVYAAAVYASVSRSLSGSLNQRLRGDIWWAAAMVDQKPDGSVTWFDPGGYGDEEGPWLQVWSLDGKVLYRSSEAQRQPVQQSAWLASQADDRIVSVATDSGQVRILTRRGRITAGQAPVVIQVARWELPMHQQLRELVLILLLGLPLAVAVAGVGGYELARRALAPVERMTERAQTITAERLSDRLPVQTPDDEMGRLA